VPKDFYQFSRQHQLETANVSNKASPAAIHVFFLEAKAVEQVKATVVKARGEQIKSSGNKSFSFF
jgi:hypothetical protein